MLKPLTVWITINWKILKETGIPDHLTCLLRNLYAGQGATVRTRNGTPDWFQIEKGVCQGCILSCEPPAVCLGQLIFSLLSHSLKKLPPIAFRAFGPVLTLSNAAHSSPFYLFVVGYYGEG